MKKSGLLLALNGIHAALENLTSGSDSNVHYTIGCIQYHVETALGKEVKTLCDRQRAAMDWKPQYMETTK